MVTVWSLIIVAFLMWAGLLIIIALATQSIIEAITNQTKALAKINLNNQCGKIAK